MSARGDEIGIKVADALGASPTDALRDTKRGIWKSICNALEPYLGSAWIPIPANPTTTTVVNPDGSRCLPMTVAWQVDPATGLPVAIWLKNTEGDLGWSKLWPPAPNTVSSIGLMFSPVACYQFSRGYPSGIQDVSGSGFDLALHAGQVNYANYGMFKQGFYFDGATRLYVPGFHSELALTGDMTCLWLGIPFSFPSGSSSAVIVEHSGNGETEALNTLYSLVQGRGTAQTLNFVSEHGAGLDDSFPIGSAWAVPQALVLFGFTRKDGRVQGYCNSGFVNHHWADAVALATPTGGGSGRLLVGGTWTGSYFYGVLDSLGIWNRALTDDEVSQIIENCFGSSSVYAAPSGTAADALTTLSSPVVVSCSAAPTAGQVLKATSATTAEWQDEAGGSSSEAFTEVAIASGGLSGFGAARTLLVSGAGPLTGLDTTGVKDGEAVTVARKSGEGDLTVSHLGTTTFAPIRGPSTGTGYISPAVPETEEVRLRLHLTGAGAPFWKYIGGSAT
jgi:hypothetical protein